VNKKIVFFFSPQLAQRCVFCSVPPTILDMFIQRIPLRFDFDATRVLAFWSPEITPPAVFSVGAGKQRLAIQRQDSA
jgi:hypothetical protein